MAELYQGSKAVASKSPEDFAKMRAAGRIPGTPAVAENVREVLDKGVRYIYTHLPRLLSGAAKAYLSAARSR